MVLGASTEETHNGSPVPRDRQVFLPLLLPPSTGMPQATLLSVKRAIGS